MALTLFGLATTPAHADPCLRFDFPALDTLRAGRWFRPEGRKPRQTSVRSVSMMPRWPET